MLMDSKRTRSARFTIGAKQMIVAVNKIDACGNKQSRFDEIKKEVADYLTKFIYKP